MKKNRDCCPLCGGVPHRVDKKNLLRGKLVSELVVCKRCDLGFLTPQPSPDFLKEIYEFEHSNKEPPGLGSSRQERVNSQAKEAKERYQGYLSFLKKHIGEGKGLKILDYGCGQGHFLKLAEREGFLTYGLEISKEAASIARERHKLRVSSLEEKQLKDYPANSFDVFSAFHVIEHTTDPLKFLKDCFRIVKPGGRIILAAPNYRFIIDRTLGLIRRIKFNFDGEMISKIDFVKRSFVRGCEITKPLDEDDELLVSEYKLRNFHHLYYFSSKSLGKMVLEAGYENIKTSPGFVKPGSSFAKKLFRNRIINRISVIFGRQEELLLVASKPSLKMRIGIEVRSLSRLNSGIGNHTYNIVKNLLEIDRKNQYFLYSCRSFDEDFLKAYPNVVFRKFSFPNGTLWTQTILPFQIMKDRLHVFHSPETMVPLLSEIPSVATVHDLISFLYPEGHDPKAKAAARLYPLIFKKAKKLIVVSQNTRDDLVKLFKISPSKMEVVSNSYNEELFTRSHNVETVLKKYRIGSPYILTVGVLSPRKNIVRLIEAYNLVKDKINISLVIVGPKGWSFGKIYEKVEELGLVKRVIFTGSVPREDLPALYSGASLFAYPSLYEGFGIPPLEAMACGAPVVSSNTSSLPEVVGDAGITFDPKDVKAFAGVMIKVLTDKRIAEVCRNKGFERSRKFSWRKSAEKTLNIYKEVAAL